MYGAFLYQEDGDGYVTPFLIGIYDSIESFKQTLPEIEKDLNQNFNYITYPKDNSRITVGFDESLLSLEEISINEIHHYWHPNDMED